MKKALLLIILSFSLQASAQDSIWFKGTLQEAEEAAKQHNKLILLMLTSTST